MVKGWRIVFDISLRIQFLDPFSDFIIPVHVAPQTKKAFCARTGMTVLSLVVLIRIRKFISETRIFVSHKGTAFHTVLLFVNKLVDQKLSARYILAVMFVKDKDGIQESFCFVQ